LGTVTDDTKVSDVNTSSQMGTAETIGRVNGGELRWGRSVCEMVRDESTACVTV